MDSATVKDVSSWSKDRLAEWLEGRGQIYPTGPELRRCQHNELVNNVLDWMDREAAARESLRERLGDAIVGEAAAANAVRAAEASPGDTGSIMAAHRGESTDGYPT